jgi:hypothetical protein
MIKKEIRIEGISNSFEGKVRPTNFLVHNKFRLSTEANTTEEPNISTPLLYLL